MGCRRIAGRAETEIRRDIAAYTNKDGHEPNVLKVKTSGVSVEEKPEAEDVQGSEKRDIQSLRPGVFL